MGKIGERKKRLGTNEKGKKGLKLNKGEREIRRLNEREMR